MIFDFYIIIKILAAVQISFGRKTNYFFHNNWFIKVYSVKLTLFTLISCKFKVK